MTALVLLFAVAIRSRALTRFALLFWILSGIGYLALSGGAMP